MGSQMGHKFSYIRLRAIISEIFSAIDASNREFTRKVESLERRNTPPFPIWDASEPSVRAVFHDLVKPMDTVFDIGAHIGALTSTLARIVGPRGVVLAFEASTATAQQLNVNLSANHHTNVTVIHGAVYREPGKLLPFADNGAASGVTAQGERLVESVQIDDVCAKHKLVPAFLKIDIEGAEHEALLGAHALLESSQPHIVFEHNIGNDMAINLLTEKGYILFDAATYRLIKSSADFDPGMDIANIIAVHSKKIDDTVYRVTPSVVCIREFRASQLLVEANVASITTELEPGRYIFEIIGAVHPETQTMYSRVNFQGEVLGQLWTDARFFIVNHRHLPFQARFAGQHQFEVGEISSSTGVVERLSIKIHRVDFARGTSSACDQS